MNFLMLRFSAVVTLVLQPRDHCTKSLLRFYLDSAVASTTLEPEMRGGMLPALKSSVWQKSSSYVQVNIYGTNIKGLREKGVDIKHLLQHVGCHSVVMDVPILNLDPRKSGGIANLRRTESWGGGYFTQPRSMRASCSTKTTNESRDCEDSEMVCSESDCERNAHTDARTHERAETSTREGSSVSCASYSGPSNLPGDDIIFHDCLEEFMEDNQDTYLVHDSNKLPISSCTSTKEATRSKLSHVESSTSGSHKMMRLAELGKETCVASPSDPRDVENSSTEHSEKFTKYGDDLHGNDEVEESTLFPSRQEPPGALNVSYESNAADGLHIVDDECSDRSNGAMQVESTEMDGLLHVSASQTANVNSCHHESGWEQAHSHGTLKLSPPSAATNEGHEIGTNEINPLFDKENTQKCDEGVACPAPAVKYGKRKRVRKPSVNSQNSLDDEDDNEEQNVCEEPKANSAADASKITSQVFHCQMPDCGKSLCYRQRYGKHRLVNHVRTHWRKPVKVCRLCGFKDITTKKIHDHHMKMHRDTQYPGADSVETKQDLDELLRLWNICFPGVQPDGIIRSAPCYEHTYHEVERE
ncbi:hypothetical protein Y032_0002g807 [Ancylostoma ceylanicum]|nr:hypothetical protein Y032_0002g807 [Ancylostoma ceylanicum]